MRWAHVTKEVAHDGDLAFVVRRPPVRALCGGSFDGARAEHQHAAVVVDAPHPQPTEHVLPEQQGRIWPADGGDNLTELAIADAQTRNQESPIVDLAAVG